MQFPQTEIEYHLLKEKLKSTHLENNCHKNIHKITDGTFSVFVAIPHLRIIHVLKRISLSTDTEQKTKQLYFLTNCVHIPGEI